MENSSCFPVLISSLLIGALIISANAGGDHGEFGSTPVTIGCRGSVAECMAGDEFEMDSEINRRILATINHISYGALQRNVVPCFQRGVSYYNCQPV
ncbi:unnamed protein product [Ilex paraguariensis]|uniref:Uncharacterized protein n=1 Tax=Ilex paraguariensis TaxID=185542 RepID=A0ABC8U1I1_9AQUA